MLISKKGVKGVKWLNFVLCHSDFNLSIPESVNLLVLFLFLKNLSPLSLIYSSYRKKKVDLENEYSRLISSIIAMAN